MISKEIEANLTRASWVRKMFEQGNRLKSEYGKDQVFDFSLGNPIFDPPAQFKSGLEQILNDPTPGKHRYMPNAGLESVRAFVAEQLAAEQKLPFKAEHIVMTVGAGGALNIVFKSILNPGDEVVTFSPYFMEYDFYVENHGGRLKLAETDAEFKPDLVSLEAKLNHKVRAVLINSPHNPTGVVYHQKLIDQIGLVIQEAEKKYGQPILLISDEPYRELIYGDAENGSVFHAHPNSLMVTSHSKDYGLAGERIGYLALHPALEDQAELMQALIFANRVLGFVNAPALMQRVLPYLANQPNLKNDYAHLKNLAVDLLKELGYDFVMPEGAFYIFPKAPIEDDVEFMERALKHRILVVPGRGFGKPGYFRMSYSVEPKTLERSKEHFLALAKEFSS